MEPVQRQETTFQTQPETPPTVWNKGVKGGVITGIIMIVYSLLMYITEAKALQSASFLFSLIALIIGIYLTHKAFKDENAGFMTYSQGLGLGSALGIVSGVLGGIFTFIYLSFVDTGYMARQMDVARIQLEERGHSDAQIDQAMSVTEMLSSPGILIVISILGSLFMAFILSLIVSAFTKHNHPEQVY
jgi:heme A synthase